MPVNLFLAAMLGNSAVAVVMRTRPRAIPLAVKTMRKSLHGLPFLSHMSKGLRLAAQLRYEYGAPFGGPLGCRSSAIINMVIVDEAKG